MAMGNIDLAHAVKRLCGAVVSSQVGRTVPPTCVALTAGCTTGCPERRLANKQLGKSLQLLVLLPSLRTAIKCFCSGSVYLEAFFQAAPFLSSLGTISHTIVFLSHLQEEQSAWTCSQYDSPPRGQEQWAESQYSLKLPICEAADERCRQSFFSVTNTWNMISSQFCLQAVWDVDFQFSHIMQNGFLLTLLLQLLINRPNNNTITTTPTDLYFSLNSFSVRTWPDQMASSFLS